MNTITRRFLLLATALSSTAAPPAVSPAFEFMSVHGTGESIAKYKGKAVALYLFNPGWSHCKIVCQVLAAIQRESGDKLQVLGATFTEDAGAYMPSFLDQIRPPFPVGISSRAKALAYLGVKVDDGRNLPHLVLIDAKGMIRASLPWHHPVFQDPRQQESRLREAIGQTMAPTARNK